MCQDEKSNTKTKNKSERGLRESYNFDTSKKPSERPSKRPKNKK